jgi:hypothetical protein
LEVFLCGRPQLFGKRDLVVQVGLQRFTGGDDVVCVGRTLSARRQQVLRGATGAQGYLL